MTARLTLALLAAALVAAPSGNAFASDPTAADRLPGEVLCGIDVLAADHFAALRGQKVGLITNHTGLDRFGHSTLELLNDAPDVDLVALFSPEHGIAGKLDAHVGDSQDPTTGLRIYSLYGETRRPTDEMLAGVDTLVFDIQDIGARFYTYIATLGLTMEAAAQHHIRYVVLDRPNPITGTRVFGPLPDVQDRFTSYHNIPIVHGMTVGELARMYNAERNIGVELEVIKTDGWRRSMWLDETLRTWVNPSPNMRSLTQATLYPAVCLIEACNVSVGRGTDTPFELFGAPWIDSRQLASRLNSLDLKGIRFLSYHFTPTASKHAKTECGGVQIVLIDRNAFDPMETGLAIVRELNNLFGDDFEVDKVNNLLFSKQVLEAVKKSPRRKRFEALWEDDLTEFTKRRESFLLYE